MAKKVAVLAVNPVNGFGLFQYLETFFENDIPYKVYAVADTKEIKTNSGITITVDDVIANLKGKEDEYDALVFGCGDAIPKFSENADKTYNQDLMAVIKAFADKDKIMIGHCAAGMMFEFAGIAAGKTISLHPLAQAAIQKANVSGEKCAIDGNFYTAETESTIWTMMDKLVEALKK
ncbi:MAG: DJ-1/PfpI family protein [Bacteroides sp.]|nr:DJ-1/PfpI family protein [Bacteroides sp.]